MTSPANRKIVIPQRFFDDRSRIYLEAHGFTVELVPLPPGVGDGDLDSGTLCQKLDGAVCWIVGHARVTRDFQALPGLQAMARRGLDMTGRMWKPRVNWDAL